MCCFIIILSIFPDVKIDKIKINHKIHFKKKHFILLYINWLQKKKKYDHC